MGSSVYLTSFVLLSLTIKLRQQWYIPHKILKGLKEIVHVKHLELCCYK